MIGSKYTLLCAIPSVSNLANISAARAPRSASSLGIPPTPKSNACSTVRDDKNSEESLLGGITLEERLLYELKYYREYGHHASMEDSMNVCLGSQFIGGSKPTVSISKDNRFLLGCAIGYGYNIGCQVVY